MNRRTLILDGAQAASDVRDQLGLDLIAPVDPYLIAEGLGIRVRFLPVSMEGFYQKGNPPRIMLSALRPLAPGARRTSGAGAVRAAGTAPRCTATTPRPAGRSAGLPQPRPGEG